MKQAYLLAALMLLFSVLHAQEKKFTPEQLKRDFGIFRSALEESHPGLYRYRSKAEMDGWFDKSSAKLDKPLDAREFYRQLTPVISALGCGHSGVRLPAEWVQRHPVRERRLPVDVVFIDGACVISKNYSDEQDFTVGTTILSVDGKPVKQIADEVLPNIPGDGFVMTSRYNTLGRFFSRYMQIFISEGPDYTVELKAPLGTIRKMKMNLVPESSIRHEPGKPDLEFKTIDNTTALLTVRSFDSNISDDKGNGFTTFLASAFKTLKDRKIKSLIIDVRDNGGGRDDYGALLFGYLTDKPFRYYAYLEMNKPTLSFLKYTDLSEDYRDRLNSTLVRNVDGRYFYGPSKHPALPVQPSQPDHFDGNVVVLIDGGSFSATAEFASAVRQNKRAIFIGEETGGAFEGNTSGGSAELTLPETKVKVVIPLTKYACAVDLDPKLKGRGILADVELKPDIASIISGKDKVMEVALQKIREKTR